MFFIVLVLIIVCIGMPLAYSWRVARLDVPTKGAWLIHVAESSVLVALVFLVGRWDMAGHYMRFILMAVFLGAVLWSLRTHMSRPWIVQELPAFRQHWTTMVSLALFGGALCYVLYGLVPPQEAASLHSRSRAADTWLAKAVGSASSIIIHRTASNATRWTSAGLTASAIARLD